jgi:hypothetical protein
MLRTESPHVLAVLATWRHNAVLAVHNFADAACEVRHTVPASERTPLTNLRAPERNAPDGRERHVLAMEPYAHRWFLVGPLLDVICREPC